MGESQFPFTCLIAHDDAKRNILEEKSYIENLVTHQALTLAI